MNKYNFLNLKSNVLKNKLLRKNKINKKLQKNLLKL